MNWKPSIGEWGNQGRGVITDTYYFVMLEKDEALCFQLCNCARFLQFHVFFK